MLKSTFTAFFRSFTRHPLYALLNMFGLSLGIAVFITLALFYRFETSFETWIPHADRIYVVENAWTLSAVTNDPEPWTNGSMLDDLKTDNPGLVGTRQLPTNVTIHIGAQSTLEQENLVDPDFFKVFDLPLAAGDKATALASPDGVVLSKAMADKYFPDGKALGKTIRLTDDEGTHDYRVSAVLKTIPDNTDHNFDVLRQLTRTFIDNQGNWHHYGNQRLETDLLLSGPAEAARLNAQYPAFADRHAANQFGTDVPHTILHSKVYPLTGLHLQDPKTHTSIAILGIVGVLAFLIAAINYINLATARAGMRAKEVAVRKTLGATQGTLRSQFLCEALLTTLIAALIGLSLVELSLPLINSFGDLKLRLDYVNEGLPLAAAGAFILLVGLLAGVYPAFVLAGFKPAQVLASSRSPAGGRLAIVTREVLVIAQFTVVVAFFIMIAGFFSQLHHMKTADIGFNRQGLMITDSTYDAALTNAQRDVIWTAFRAIPGVISVTASTSAPGDNSLTNNTDGAKKGYVGHKPSINWIIIGPDYFTTYQSHLVLGRLLDPARGDDVYFHWDDKGIHAADVGVVTNVVVNRSAVTQMGFKNPQEALNGLADFDGDRTIRIVGIIDDMRFRSPKDKIAPSVYALDLTPWSHAVTGVRYAGMSESDMRTRLQQAWRRIAPDVPFKAVSAVDNIDAYYKPDRNRSNLFAVGAGVAAFIGCIGLYGMAAFNTSRRAREVGLRKVLGASAGSVTRLLVTQFLRPVVIANLLAWPLAYIGLKNWLSQFDDAIPVTPVYFAAATAAAMAIALVTVAWLAFAAAATEPGKALRHE